VNLTPPVLLAILFAPLVAFVVQILAGRRLFGATPYLDPADAPHDDHGSHAPGNRVAGAIIPILGILFPLLLTLLFIVPSMATPTEPYYLPEGGRGALWMDFGGGRELRIGLQVDNTAKVLVFMVTLVCSMIHLFAAAYMKTRDGVPEPRYTRFFAYLSLFTFSMLLLSLSDNLLTLFVGWELMGLCSYLLIGFYYEKKSACDASLKAFMTTRIGDVLLFLALAIIWTSIGGLRFADIYAGIQSGKLGGGLLTAAGILALGGAIGKSAQFPLHTWLPDAMEGPTPVSALIHAATMVAAGVYLSARLLQIGVLDASAALFIAYIGAFTAVFAASIAFVQNDIKKVLAYSTISQLGYMMLAVGVGNYTAAIFHLLTHAFFKACLFLGSGSVIHALHEGFHHVHSHADAQDMRNMGGLRKKMPLTFATFFVSTLAISGVPLTSGFLSKDAILAGSLAFTLNHPEHFLLAVGGFGAALMTAFYMFRLVFMTFFGEPAERADEAHRAEIAEAHRHLHESPALITVPLIVLAVFAIGFFWSLNPFAEGWIGEVATKQDRWMVAASAEPSPERAEAPAEGEHASEPATESPAEAHSDSEHTAHNVAMVLSLVVAGTGIFLSILVYVTRSLRVDRLASGTFAGILRQKYGFDELYDYLFVRNLLRVNRTSAAFDNRVVDGAVNGIARALGSGRYSFTWFSGAVDRYVVDGAVNGVASVLRGFGAAFRRVQSGMLNGYLLVVFTGLVVLIFIFSALIR
jgi:NADH-quinone oxidoreductase subunit L